MDKHLDVYWTRLCEFLQENDAIWRFWRCYGNTLLWIRSGNGAIWRFWRYLTLCFWRYLTLRFWRYLTLCFWRYWTWRYAFDVTLLTLWRYGAFDTHTHTQHICAHTHKTHMHIQEEGEDLCNIDFSLGYGAMMLLICTRTHNIYMHTHINTHAYTGRRTRSGRNLCNIEFSLGYGAMMLLIYTRTQNICITQDYVCTYT